MTTAKVGRPTKYKKEYCELLIDIIRGGGFVENFCESVDVHIDTFYEWVKVHKEFSEAYKRARTFAKAEFLGRVRDAAWGITEARVNNGLITLLAVNLYGMKTKDSAEREETEEAQPVKVEIVRKSGRKD